MITQNQVLDAMALASLDLTGTNPLARALHASRAYIGTLQSAIECLEQAEYEVKQ